MKEYSVNCEIARDLMPLVLDGVASASAREAVNAHVAGCEACQRVMQAMGAEGAAAAGISAEASDTRFAQFCRRMKRQFTRQHIVAWIAGLLAVAALLVGAGRFAHYQMYINSKPLRLTAEDVTLYVSENDSLVLSFEATEAHPYVGTGWYIDNDRQTLYYLPQQPAWRQLFGLEAATGTICDYMDALCVIDGQLMYCEFESVVNTDEFGNPREQWQMTAIHPVKALWVGQGDGAQLLFKAGDSVDFPLMREDDPA